MDSQQVNVFQELNNMQSRITSLFQDIVNERNEYKLNSDNLNRNLEKVSAEMKDLTRQNECLKERNEELRKIVFECFKLFGSLNFSNLFLNENYKSAVEAIKKTFFQTCNKLENEVISVEISLEGSTKNSDLIASRGKLNEEDIKKEIDSIQKLNFSTQFDDEDKKMFAKNEWMLNKNMTGYNLERLFERKPVEVVEKLRVPLLVSETEGFASQNLNTASVSETVHAVTQEVTPRKECIGEKSPVFKDFANWKQDSLYEGASTIGSKPSSLKMVSEKFLLKSAELLVSPLKRPSSEANSSSPTREQSTPKRTRKKLNVNSPMKSPNCQIRRSNSKEAEISRIGVRKLTQTLLNIECFKKKTPEKRKDIANVENENSEGPTLAGIKIEVDGDEDDVIIESPRNSDQVLEDIKNKRSGDEGDGCSYLTPPRNPGADLDETFVSSSIVRKCKLTDKHVLERVIEDQTPLKRPEREKSPEYDSVPFKYKREPVRKKAERMKLPGHACVECNKYYKEAFGDDLNSHNLKQILNKCSRHRDHLSPTSEETPPGYWKPYLTCTAVSPNKDNTVLR